MCSDYVFKEVKPKDGVMKEIHYDVLGRRCYIIALEKGQRGFIKFEPEYDMGRFHRLHTSTVVDWSESEDGKILSIETANTTYVLEHISSLREFYGKGFGFSRDEAEHDIISYLTNQDDTYFEERGTSKAAVLSNDCLIDNLASEHYKCVMGFGNEREWSCRDACDHDPGIVV